MRETDVQYMRQKALADVNLLAKRKRIDIHVTAVRLTPGAYGCGVYVEYTSCPMKGEKPVVTTDY